MKYTAEHLKPSPCFIEIAGYELELHHLSLDMIVRFKKQYGDIDDVYKLLKKNPTGIINVMWYLVIDKHLFNNKFQEFKKSFTNSPSLEKLTEKCFIAWDETVTDSMPVVINKKRSEDINKLKKGEDSKPCYAKYYDSIAKRYGGMSLGEFYNLTLRQIYTLLRTINDESYTELEVKASLAGKKLKPRIVYNEVSEEEEKEQDNQAQDAVARLQKEYEERMAKKQGSE